MEENHVIEVFKENKFLLQILLGGLYRYIYIHLYFLFYHLLIVFHPKTIDKLSKSQNCIKLLQIFFALGLTVMGGV